MKDDPNYSNADVLADIFVGIIFCVGIVVSCLPQHVNCCKAKSAQGLSLTTIHFSTISSTCSFLSAFLEDAPSIASAPGVLRTWAVAMPSIQNALGLITGQPLYTVYYYLWYEDTEAYITADGAREQVHIMSSQEEVNEGPISARSRSGPKRQEIYSTVATLLLTFLIAIVSILGLSYPHLFNRDFQIKLWGGVGGATNAVQWLPQVVKTWRLQNAGVLSHAALVFGALGDWLLLGYWVAIGESFWIWCCLVSDSLMQVILLGMIIQFQRRDRGEEEDDSTLEQPLLSGDDGDRDNDETAVNFEPFA